PQTPSGPTPAAPPNVQASNTTPVLPAPPPPSGPAAASTSPPPVSPAPASAPSGTAKGATTTKAMTAVTIADGTGFRITLAGDFPADAKKGYSLTFKVNANVLVAGDMVAIAKGALVTGAIVDEKKK